LAQLANGGHVVVWKAAAPTNSSPSLVYAQLFDPSDQPVGAPIAVFGTARSFDSHAVVGLPDGGFMVSGSTQAYDVASNKAQIRLYVQKVSASGELLPTGGMGDADVNGGLADRVLTENTADYIAYQEGPFFLDADGSYVLAVRHDQRPIPVGFFHESLLKVDASGNVVEPQLEPGYASEGWPAVARLRSGTFFFASNAIVASHGFPAFAPLTWKIVTSTGQAVAQQTLGADTAYPQIAALSDGTGLLVWTDTATNTLAGQRVDANGNVLGPVSTPSSNLARVAPLVAGGYVFVWTSGSDLLAQYFTSSGAPAGNPFALANNAHSGDWPPTFAIEPTADGFRVAYQTTSQQVDEVRVKSPPVD
jgi:hypothetical protein